MPKTTSPDKAKHLAKFKLHYGQTLVWNARNTHRVISMIAGSGGGKTWFGPRYFYDRIQRYPDATYIFIEPTFKMLRLVMLPGVIEYNDLRN